MSDSSVSRPVKGHETLLKNRTHGEADRLGKLENFLAKVGQ